MEKEIICPNCLSKMICISVPGSHHRVKCAGAECSFRGRSLISREDAINDILTSLEYGEQKRKRMEEDDGG